MRTDTIKLHIYVKE